MKSYDVFALLPSGIFALYTLICALQEHIHGCGTVRHLGHSGLFFIFWILSLYDIRFARMTVAVFSAFAYEFVLMPILFKNLFIASAIWLGTRLLTVEIALVIFVLCHISIKDNISDAEIFAWCGHMTLLTMCWFELTSFTPFLSFLLIGCFVLIHFPDELNNTVLLLYVALIHSMIDGRFFFRIRGKKPWFMRTLWQVEYGMFSSISLFCHLWFIMLSHIICSNDSCVLHALHVGGIFAVCFFIYPQISPEASPTMKYILMTASGSDSLLSMTNIVVNYETMDLINIFVATNRSLFSIMFCLGIYKTNMCDVNTVEIPSADIDIETHLSVPDLFRTIGITIFIILSFFNHTTMKTHEGFAYIIHVCFIIGSLAFEALFSRSKLLCYLTWTMATSLFIAILVDIIFNEITNWTEMVALFCLFVSIPPNSVPQVSVLSFTDEDFSHTVV